MNLNRNTAFIPDLPERLAELARHGAAVALTTMSSRGATVSAQAQDADPTPAERMTVPMNGQAELGTGRSGKRGNR